MIEYITEAGSTAQALQAQLTEVGLAVDLSGATATVRAVAALDRSEVRIDDEAATVGTDGTVSYTLSDEEVEAGALLVRWTVALEGGQVYVSPWIPWRIRA